MALFEYRCGDCGVKAEILMQPGDKSPSCPSCGSTQMEKQLSTFAVSSPSAGSSDPAPACTSGCCGGSCGL